MDRHIRERFQRADAIFGAALERPAAQRAAYVDGECGSDAELRAAVQRLLQAHDRSAGFLNSPAVEHAGSLLESLLDGSTLPLPAPRQLGPFRVGREIGRGGMGAVYLGERADGQFEQHVALKLVRGGAGADDLVRHFLQERRILAGLEHPGIARLIDGGVSQEGIPWFAMEFVEGLAITRYACERQLALRERLRLFDDVCAAVEYAHARHVIHRDLKPGNILVTGDGAVKLLDFGIAKLLEPDTVTADVSTTTGPGPLTPEYAAPEQLRCAPASAATDIYALGVILYELLAGDRPHRLQGRTAGEIERIVCETDPPPPSAVVRRMRGAWRPLRGDLDTIVLKALHKEPRSRYASVAALRADLLRSASGRPILARPRSVTYVAHRFMRRHRSLAAMALLFPVAAGLTSWFLGQSASANASRGNGSPPAPARLVVADFDISGADSGFGPILGHTLRRYLSQSSVISVVPEDQVVAALRLMSVPPGSALNTNFARRVAQREGLGAVVGGEFTRDGPDYLLAARIVDPATGNATASFRERVERPTDLFPGLARLAVKLRGAHGEPVDSLRADAGSDAVTTSSFAALLKFSQARRLPPLQGGITPAMARMREAIALDSNFAMAHFMVATYYLNFGVGGPLRDSAIAKAYALRDRLAPRERVAVTTFHLQYVMHDRPRAAAEYGTHLARDSADTRSATNLGWLLTRSRQFASARAHYRAFGNSSYINRHSLLLAEGKFAEADSLASLGGTTPLGSLTMSMRTALGSLRFDSAAVLTTLLRSHASGSLGNVATAEIQVSTARTRGRLTEARRFASEVGELRRSIGVTPILDPLDAVREELWLRGDAMAAVARLDAVYGPSAMAPLMAADVGPALAAASLYAAAGRPERARRLLDVALGASAPLTQRATYSQYHAALAEIALAEGRAEEALAAFQRSDLAADGWPVSPCTVCVLPHLARAAERAGWLDSATVYWQRYVSTVAFDRLDTDSWFLAIAYRRLAELHARRGDDAEAARYAGLFVSLWRDADRELQPQVERARRRFGVGTAPLRTFAATAEGSEVRR